MTQARRLARLALIVAGYGLGVAVAGWLIHAHTPDAGRLESGAGTGTIWGGPADPLWEALGAGAGAIAALGATLLFVRAPRRNSGRADDRSGAETPSVLVIAGLALVILMWLVATVARPFLLSGGSDLGPTTASGLLSVKEMEPGHPCPYLTLASDPDRLILLSVAGAYEKRSDGSVDGPGGAHWVDGDPLDVTGEAGLPPPMVDLSCPFDRAIAVTEIASPRQ